MFVVGRAVVGCRMGVVVVVAGVSVAGVAAVGGGVVGAGVVVGWAVVGVGVAVSLAGGVVGSVVGIVLWWTVLVLGFGGGVEFAVVVALLLMCLLSIVLTWVGVPALMAVIWLGLLVDAIGVVFAVVVGVGVVAGGASGIMWAPKLCVGRVLAGSLMLVASGLG